ncbi:hypothetical protein HJC23_001462 [Cyclotella cryptica]|uniref:Enoyl-CoA hydratase/isomerase domain-containing protein n=1 Tax=Cyclotella cryptica TaxID=29204 RepID=A0ABD3NV99_9STRA
MMRIALLHRTNCRFASDLWRRLATRHGEMSSMSSTDSWAPQHEAIPPFHPFTVDRFAKSLPFVASNRYHSSSTNANESTDTSSTITYSKRPATVAATTIPASSNSNDHRVKLSHLDQGIVHVQLSRPQKLNSLDMPMFESIAESASRLQNDRTVRVVILSGEGRAFCTGLDAKSVALEAGSGALERLLERPSGYGGVEGKGNLAQDVAFLWRQLPVPVIAVLHGMCFGGGTYSNLSVLESFPATHPPNPVLHYTKQTGMQIALGADFRFSTPDCKLSIMEARWGLIPDMSASVTLRELVRIDVAKELTMTGRIISGLEGEKIGLVTRCVEDPMAEALRVAREIVERSPDSVAATKELFNTTWVADEEQCLKQETTLQLKLIKTYNQIAASEFEYPTIEQLDASIELFRSPKRSNESNPQDQESHENDRQIKATFIDSEGNQVKELIPTFRDSDPRELLLKLEKELLKFGSHYDLFQDGRWKLLGQIGGRALKGRIARYWRDIIEGTTNHGKGEPATQQAKFKKLIKKVNMKYFGKDAADDQKTAMLVENSDATTKTTRKLQNDFSKSTKT